MFVSHSIMRWLPFKKCIEQMLLEFVEFILMFVISHNNIYIDGFLQTNEILQEEEDLSEIVQLVGKVRFIAFFIYLSLVTN